MKSQSQSDAALALVTIEPGSDETIMGIVLLSETIPIIVAANNLVSLAVAIDRDVTKNSKLDLNQSFPSALYSLSSLSFSGAYSIFLQCLFFLLFDFLAGTLA